MKRLLLAALAILAGVPGPAAAQVRDPADPDRNPWTHLRFRNDPDRFQFGIICDRTGGNRPGVFESGIRKLNLLQPEFVVCVGDLVGGYTEDRGAIDRERGEAGRRSPEGVRAVCRATATGHVSEIAVPAAYLDARQGGPWKAVRLNLGASDYDQEWSGIVAWWQPEWGSDENLAGSGTFVRK